MFQFPGLPSLWLYIHHRITTHYCSWVPSFVNLRVNGYLLLTAAYRSLSRPSSAPSAKASALCPSSLDQKCCLMALIRSSSTICYSTLSELSTGFSHTINFDKSLPSFFNRKTDIFRFSLSFASTFWYSIQFSRYILYPFGLVENKGFEPLTPCVQGRCSPSWANSP